MEPACKEHADKEPAYKEPAYKEHADKEPAYKEHAYKELVYKEQLLVIRNWFLFHNLYQGTSSMFDYKELWL